MDTERTAARRRALRAAQVVTLGLAIAGGSGCYARHEPTALEIADASAADASLPRPPIAIDGSTRAHDSGPPDAGAVADAGTGDCWAADDWAACCEEHGWSFDWGCGAWGPYVPPGEGALPASRSARAVA